MNVIGQIEMPVKRWWRLLHETEKVPKCWPEFCDSVTDNFRVINPKDFRVLA